MIYYLRIWLGCFWPTHTAPKGGTVKYIAILIVLLGLAAPAVAQEASEVSVVSACETPEKKGDAEKLRKRKCALEMALLEVELARAEQERRTLDAKTKAAEILPTDRPVQFTAVTSVTPENGGITSREDISATKLGADFKLKWHKMDTDVQKKQAEASNPCIMSWLTKPSYCYNFDRYGSSTGRFYGSGSRVGTYGSSPDIGGEVNRSSGSGQDARVPSANAQPRRNNAAPRAAKPASSAGPLATYKPYGG